ncbi:MotB-like transcriptional regulator [Escherichia phage EcS1]|uniref:Uncharacterized protein n=1 Tax=Escherichia phage EcS1 TaxID=2083276 RepID=A0A2Z5ZCA2_9CAUD|nr:MotB-like transcriptional regulator [Escherichia phage EcS1]BBC78061.1 Hypothetical protein [Escherichia phage EcS1]
MSHIIVGSRVQVSSASRSCIKGLQGVVLDIRPWATAGGIADELVIKADNGQVGYVRRKFATLINPSLEGHYVKTKESIVSNDGHQKGQELYALCTLVDGDYANIVFQGDFAWVEISNLEDLGKAKPKHFGTI